MTTNHPQIQRWIQEFRDDMRSPWTSDDIFVASISVILLMVPASIMAFGG